MDQIDQKILDVLTRDGRITVTDLAQHVGLSKTPCQARMRRLERQGFIRGYRAILDPQKMQRAHIVFVEVKLARTSETALSAFNAAVSEVAEIEQCHMIAGGFDYLLKVRTGDITAYRHVLAEKIARLPHIAQTSTYVSMQAVKD
ncbi:MAG: Lrp/AsnC ligand binding domain-containing protein [Pseudomonadota bacterium]